MDGTFAYIGAMENIKRSLDYGRKVEIFIKDFEKDLEQLEINIENRYR